MLKLAATIAGLSLLSACAMMEEREQQADMAAAAEDCFNQRMITGYNVVDDDTIRIEVGPTDQYEIDVYAGTCTDLGFSQSIALDVGARAGQFICTDELVQTANVRTDRGDRCRIREVRRVESETEVSDAAGD